MSTQIINPCCTSSLIGRALWNFFSCQVIVPIWTIGGLYWLQINVWAQKSPTFTLSALALNKFIDVKMEVIDYSWDLPKGSWAFKLKSSYVFATRPYPQWHWWGLGLLWSPFQQGLLHSWCFDGGNAANCLPLAVKRLPYLVKCMVSLASI